MVLLLPMEYPVLSVLIITLLLPISVFGQLPTVCVQNATAQRDVCCPIPAGFDAPCGGPGRGSCEKISVADVDMQYDVDGPFALKDDRVLWPLHYFKYACRCKASFQGFACQECRFGRGGPNCTEKNVLIRRNILDISQKELDQFRTALRLAKQVPMLDYSVITTSLHDDNHPSFTTLSVYDYFTFLHYHSSKMVTVDGMTCELIFAGLADPREVPLLDGAHKGPAFVTWHRYFLLLFERELQKLINSTTFALPYSNWAGQDKDCRICSNRFFGRSVNDHVDPESEYSTWESICFGKELAPTFCQWCNVHQSTGRLIRKPGHGDVKTLPTFAGVKKALSAVNYDNWPYDDNSGELTFRNLVEGPRLHSGVRYVVRHHKTMIRSRVHFFLNGIVSSPVPTTANDPLFYQIHSFVDLVFEKWYRTYKPAPREFPEDGARIGHNLKSNMLSFFPPVTNEDMFADSRTLGFDYESLDSLVQNRTSSTTTSKSKSAKYTKTHPRSTHNEIGPGKRGKLEGKFDFNDKKDWN